MKGEGRRAERQPPTGEHDGAREVTGRRVGFSKFEGLLAKLLGNERSEPSIWPIRRPGNTRYVATLSGQGMAVGRPYVFWRLLADEEDSYSV